MPSPTRRVLLAVLALFLAVPALAAPALVVRGQDQALASVTAEQYVVVDAETGEVFAQKRSDARAGMASVTKLFTLMEAVERAPLDTEITAKQSDLFGPDSTSMTGFVPGVTFTLDDLLHGMTLSSGNDAAVAIARGLAAQPGDTDEESVQRFVGWMNERAAALGLTNTHLQNPHGLSEEGHYTTPRDLSAFLMYGLTIDEFFRVMIARSFVTSTGIELFSINRAPEFIPDQIGGKTGYDDATGYCLAEVGERDGRRMIAVTFDGVAPDVWYQDQAILFDFAFSALEARLDADDPLPDDRVAFIAPGQRASQEDVPAQEEAAAPTPAADAVQASPVQEAAVPTPVRLESLPEPAPVAVEQRSITGDWVLPLAIVVGLIALLGLRRVEDSLSTRTDGRPVDTPAGPS